MIEISLVQDLIAHQFPQWKELSIHPVKTSGFDNCTFHLGDKMLIRLPSKAEYAFQVEKEQYWLPRLKSLLSIQIPTPVAMGKPAKNYPWKWSIYEWIRGESVASSDRTDYCELATDLAEFLVSFQSIDSTGGPLPSQHNFYRGGSLKVYDDEVKKAVTLIGSQMDLKTVREIWEVAPATSWQGKSVWVHGDVSPGNLLIDNGRLCAVIDFGQLAIGDPACDLAIAYTLFSGKSREVFRKIIKVDEDTWARGRAWALWKALITVAGLTNPNNSESKKSKQIIDDVISDHQNLKKN